MTRGKEKNGVDWVLVDLPFKLMIGVLLFSLAMMVDLQKAGLIFPFMPRALEG